VASNQSLFDFHNSQFDNFIAAAAAEEHNPFRLSTANSAANYPWLSS